MSNATTRPEAPAVPGHPGITEGPNEGQVKALLDAAGVRYTRPETDPGDVTNLDFRVPEAGGAYIECKLRTVNHRLRKQINRVPRSQTVIILIGPNAARDLKHLSRLLAAAPD